MSANRWPLGCVPAHSGRKQSGSQRVRRQSMGPCTVRLVAWKRRAEDAGTREKIGLPTVLYARPMPCRCCAVRGPRPGCAADAGRRVCERTFAHWDLGCSKAVGVKLDAQSPAQCLRAPIRRWPFRAHRPRRSGICGQPAGLFRTPRACPAAALCHLCFNLIASH